MKNSIIIGLSAGVLVLLLAFSCDRIKREKELKSLKELYKKEVLKNDSLVKVNETQYRKLIADTLTISQLNNKIKQLNIKLKEKPKVITEIEYVPKEVEKEVEVVRVIGDTVQIEDYYPNKKEYFVKYENEVSIKDKKGVAKFSFQPLKITSVISERKDGIFQIDFKTPEWLEVQSIDIQSTPIESIKQNNFGFLLGAGMERNFYENKSNIRIETGIRYKKMYLDLGISTSNIADLTLKFEL